MQEQPGAEQQNLSLRQKIEQKAQETRNKKQESEKARRERADEKKQTFWSRLDSGKKAVGAAFDNLGNRAKGLAEAAGDVLIGPGVMVVENALAVYDNLSGRMKAKSLELAARQLAFDEKAIGKTKDGIDVAKKGFNDFVDLTGRGLKKAGRGLAAGAGMAASVGVGGAMLAGRGVVAGAEMGVDAAKWAGNQIAEAPGHIKDAAVASKEKIMEVGRNLYAKHLESKMKAAEATVNKLGPIIDQQASDRREEAELMMIVPGKDEAENIKRKEAAERRAAALAVQIAELRGTADEAQDNVDSLGLVRADINS